MPQHRQLAAIMFTDIVGYTALMGDNEQKAFELLNKNRLLQKPIIEQYSGHWIKELGDGILASFNTVSDAVNAAVKIQEACNAINDFQLRIGIHQGEIVFEADDIFGDAVNIASRIQAIATPGGIYISESVHNNISNKQGIETKFVKQEILKNVKEPVRIYQVKTEAVETAKNRSSTNNADPKQLRVNKKLQRNRKPIFFILGTLIILLAGYFLYNNFQKIKKGANQPGDYKIIDKSIAVLPFTDMSPGKDQEYLGDGLAEDIITALSGIKELKVIGRTSSFQFKGLKIDLRDVGEKLQVSNVLQGSVQKSGNKIRIMVQLINVKDGSNTWTEKYEKEMVDIFAIEDEISSVITERLKISMLEKPGRTSDSIPTKNMEAYEMVLKGNYFNGLGPEGAEKALGYFRKAVDLDPKYADAYNGLGWAYLFVGTNNQMKEAAEKALSLNENSGRAHELLYTFYFREWNWDKAEAEYNKSLQFNSGALVTRAYHLALLGKTEQAIREMKEFVKQDPLNKNSLRIFADMYSYNHQYTDARRVLKNLLEIDPSYPPAYKSIGNSYLSEENFELAIENYKKEVELSQVKGEAQLDLITAIATSGKKDEAKRLFNLVIKDTPEKNFPVWRIVPCYFALGEKDAAFKRLNETYEDKDRRWRVFLYLKIDSFFDPYRSDPRFKELIKKMNLPG